LKISFTVNDNKVIAAAAQPTKSTIDIVFILFEIN
jgi:hypothetical protein